MNSSALRITLGFWMAAAMVGCSPSTPTFGTLDQAAIPMPLFSGSTSTEILNITATQTNAITGQCDHRIQGLTASLVGSNSNFASLAAMTVSGATINCASTGQFSFTLKSLTDLGFNIQDNTTYVIQLYGITTAGNSNPSTINVLYSKEGGTGPKHILLTSGGTMTSNSASTQRVAASPSFRAQVRVDHMLNQSSTPSPTSADSMLVKTSTSFKMKFGAAAEND